MVVIKGGTSLIACGLDHWYKRESGDKEQLDPQEYVVEEYRLQRLLDVHNFRLPPDYRERQRGVGVPNSGLTVPFLRFPRWHFCPRCGRLEQLPLTVRNKKQCDECKAKSKTVYLMQVTFIAMCEGGHIQDFPWREWAHYSANVECDRPLRWYSTGSSALSAQMIKCDCGKQRSLAGITEAEADGTNLSKNLDKNGSEAYLCRGARPWLGTKEGEPCELPLRGALRGASNVWFGQVKSAIYLPRGSGGAPADLVSQLREPPLSTLINLLRGASGEVNASQLRTQYPLPLSGYTNGQIDAALKIVMAGETDDDEQEVPGEDSETAFRRAEFNALRSDRDEEMLMVKSSPVDDYDADVARYFSLVMLVHKLRETRAFAGFSRVHAENEQTLERRKQMLRRELPEGEHDWLPATVVYGEGIFLELNGGMLQEWERKNAAALSKHLRPLVENYARVQQSRHLRDKPLSPRFLLLHTFAHMLMNRLTFECGYSSAALRERLYVSDNPGAPMAGVLIYTADGDAEGTMGGLVRMGKPDYLEPVIRRALEQAQWCSADPVCREMGESGGQGPDSCNLAACHNCALVPETACEEFNRFLDRSIVIGDIDRPGIGFFTAPVQD
jgi:hypothetical protein